MSKKIGFVGFGTMGLPVTISLNEAGLEVIGYDVFDGGRERVRAAGITVVATLREVAEQADSAIVSMVHDYSRNIEVLLGEDGLLSVDPKGLTIIVMSTLNPNSMNALDQQAEVTVDIKLIAATISGSATGAQTGTLSIMVSGPEDRVNIARPYFDAVGSSVFYYGASPGSSQATKLVSNMVLGIIMSGVAGSLKFGEHYNLPRKASLNLFKTNTGDSWVARNWDSVSKWTEDTALAALLKDLKAVHFKSLKHGITIPPNTLPFTIPLNSWDQKPKTKRT